MFSTYKYSKTIVFFKICLDPNPRFMVVDCCTSLYYSTTHFDTVRVSSWPQLRIRPQLPQHTVLTRRSSTDLWRQSSRRSFGGKVYEETLGGSLHWRQLTKKLLAAAYEESPLAANSNFAALQYSTCNSRTLLHLLQVTTHLAPNYSPTAHCIV